MTDSEQKKIFARNLTNQINKLNKMQKDVAKDIGVSATTLNNWCTGLSMPKMGKIQMLADYFGIPKTSLVDDLDLEDVERQGVEDYYFLTNFHKLSASNKEVLKSTMLALLAAQESK